MQTHADQLRNEVSDRIRVYVEEDAKTLSAVEQQLRERSEQAQSLEKQLGETREEIAGKQKQIESIEQQVHTVESDAVILRGRVGEMETALKAETERLTKHNQELEQLLELSQDEVKQLQTREEEQKKQLQELEKQVETLRDEMKKGLEAKEREIADKSAEHEQRLEDKENELKSKVAEIEQRLEQAQRQAQEQLQGKERELLEQVHLLEELLVQGQHAREQQLEAKDREHQEQFNAQKTEYENRIQEVETQLADRDKLSQAKGGELQNRIISLEKDLESGKKQLADVRNELQSTQAAFEKAQQQLDDVSAKLRQRDDEFAEVTKARAELETKFTAEAARKSEVEGMQGLWEQREKELSGQLADFEKRLADFAVAEQAWHEREQELLGHRDKVLSSSAEASQSSQKALAAALEDQGRLQTQLDALLEELGKVREELQHAQEMHHTREHQLSEEVASLRNELAAHESGTAPNVVVTGAPTAKRSPADDAAAITRAVEQIHAARSQSEILKAMLESASQFSARSGIFVVHGRSANGWAARGFGSDADFRKLSVDCSAGIAARAVQGRKYLHGAASDFDHKLVDGFGGPKDGQAYIFPMVVRDRVAAFFYADGGNQVTRDVSASSIDTVVRAAGAWLDELGAGKPATSKSAFDAMPMPVAAAAPAVSEPKPAAVMAAAAAATAVAGDAPAGTDASRQRARRFAKLLVDEIKLYNKDAVEQGRRNSDLYDRLRESIDKSRASYDKRWGKTITDVDYFREELVRNLAENNVAILGNNFPR